MPMARPVGVHVGCLKLACCSYASLRRPPPPARLWRAGGGGRRVAAARRSLAGQREPPSGKAEGIYTNYAFHLRQRQSVVNASTPSRQRIFFPSAIPRGE